MIPGAAGSRAHAALRRRIRLLHDQIDFDRKQELGRAAGFRNRGDNKQAAYHIGLADGRNAMLAELRILMREYPSRDAS